jgi:serine/threonine protein kinase
VLLLHPPQLLIPLLSFSLYVSSASYILQEVIGQGSFGIVRKCKHKTTGQLFACKTILKSKIPDLQVLKREIDNLQMVRHPFIIRLEDVYEDAQHVHLVTELCTGGELYDKVVALARTRQKHFDEATAAHIIRNILSALLYLHEVKHIVHRDLKASNFLFVSPKHHPTHIKIIDFGLSRIHERQDVMRSRVGTPYYVAPEVLTSDYTNKCDVWSIGVIAYMLLSGTLPFLAADERQTIQLVQHAEVAFDKKEWQGISEQAKQFVSYLLQKDPEQRPNAREAMNHEWIVSYCGPPPLSTDDCDNEDRHIRSLGGSMPSSKIAPLFTMNSFLRLFGTTKSPPAVVEPETK